MARRWPNGDLPMTGGFIEVRQRSAGGPAVSGGPPDDYRQDAVGESSENVDISRANRTVPERSPSGRREAPAG